MACDLCEEEKTWYRGCKFGGKNKSICTDCLAQFTIDGIDKLYVVLKSRD